MGKNRKPEVVTNHAGEFLKSLRTRAGLSIRGVAAATMYSRQAIHVAEVRARHASMDVMLAFARACGASRDELDRVATLVAMDKGAIDVALGVTESRVLAARRVLAGG